MARPTDIALTAVQVEDTLDHLEELLDQIRTEHRQLRRRHLAEKDGHRTHASGSGDRSPAGNENDEDGTPMPPRPSDPTATHALARNEPTDPVGHALIDVVERIQTMRRLGEAAISDAAQVRPPIKTQNADELWCTNCKKSGHQEPREEGRTLCRWCRSELAKHKRLPTRRLVDAHVRGLHITDKLRSEIHQREREDRARNKAKKYKPKMAVA